MVDEYSCDIAAVLAAEDGGLIPYLERKKEVKMSFNRYKVPKVGPVYQQEGLHIILPGAATPIKVSCL